MSIWIQFKDPTRVYLSDLRAIFNLNAGDSNWSLITNAPTKPKVDMTGKPCGKGQNAARDKCIPKVKPVAKGKAALTTAPVSPTPKSILPTTPTLPATIGPPTPQVTPVAPPKPTPPPDNKKAQADFKSKFSSLGKEDQAAVMKKLKDSTGGKDRIGIDDAMKLLDKHISDKTPSKTDDQSAKTADESKPVKPTDKTPDKPLDKPSGEEKPILSTTPGKSTGPKSLKDMNDDELESKRKEAVKTQLASKAGIERMEATDDLNEVKAEIASRTKSKSSDAASPKEKLVDTSPAKDVPSGVIPAKDLGKALIDDKETYDMVNAIAEGGKKDNSEHEKLTKEVGDATTALNSMKKGAKGITGARKRVADATKALEVHKRANAISVEDARKNLINTINPGGTKLPIVSNIQDDVKAKGWQHKINDALDFVSSIAGAHASNPIKDLVFTMSKDNRASAKSKRVGNSDTDFVRVSSKDASSTVHELGHILEDHIPGASEAVNEFLKHRVGDEKPTKLKDVFPKNGYRDDEFGRKDDFEKAFGSELSGFYAGKTYPNGCTEILSKGIEQLHRDPQAFCKNDPEYAAMIIRILKGKHLR